MSGESSSTKRGTKRWYKARLLDLDSRGEFEQVCQTATAMENRYGRSWDTDYYKYLSSHGLDHIDDAKNIAHRMVTQHNYPNAFDHAYLILDACERMDELGELAEAKPIVKKLKHSMLTGATAERIIGSRLKEIDILESRIKEAITRKEAEQVSKAERKREKNKRKHARKKELQAREKPHRKSIEGARIEMAREEAEDEKESIEGATFKDEGKIAQELYMQPIRIEMAREEAEDEKECIEGATFKDERKIAQELCRQPIRIEMGPHCHILVESKDSYGLYHGKKIWYESLVEFVSMMPMSDLNEALTTYATLKELEADFVLKCHGVVDSPEDNSIKLLVVQRISTLSSFLKVRYDCLKVSVDVVSLSSWWSHIRGFYHQFARDSGIATLALIQKDMLVGENSYITHEEHSPKFIPSQRLNLVGDAKRLSASLEKILLFCTTQFNDAVDLQILESEDNYVTELNAIKRTQLLSLMDDVTISKFNETF